MLVEQISGLYSPCDSISWFLGLELQRSGTSPTRKWARDGIWATDHKPFKPFKQSPYYWALLTSNVQKYGNSLCMASYFTASLDTPRSRESRPQSWLAASRLLVVFLRAFLKPQGVLLRGVKTARRLKEYTAIAGIRDRKMQTHNSRYLLLFLQVFQSMAIIMWKNLLKTVARLSFVIFEIKLRMRRECN